MPMTHTGPGEPFIASSEVYPGKTLFDVGVDDKRIGWNKYCTNDPPMCQQTVSKIVRRAAD